MSLRRTLVLCLALLGLFSLALSAASGRSAAAGLVEGRLAPCPSPSNCVNSESSGRRSSIAPLAFSGEAAAAFRSLIEFLRGEPGVHLLLVEDDYAHAVFRTPLLRFRDDVELRLDPSSRVIHIRSASRIGYSDLGANRERVESIRERWTPAEALDARVAEQDPQATTNPITEE